jgi:hypothetical protein
MTTRRLGCAALGGLGLLGLVATAHAKVLLSSPVSWVNASGDSGFVPFQGAVDGADLAGVVDAGTARAIVAGTVDAGGVVTGTLRAPGGSVIGSFAGTFEDEQLHGVFTVTGELGGGWAAPSDGTIAAEATP